MTGSPYHERPPGLTSGQPLDSGENEAISSVESMEDQVRQIEEQISAYQEHNEEEEYDLKRSRFNAGLAPED